MQGSSHRSVSLVQELSRREGHSSRRLELAHDRVVLAKVRLTAREAEVTTWIARGKTYAQIARLLSITEDTAKFHIENVRRKLNATNRTHAIVLAVVNKLVEF
jgi:DNA-binding CsgD family transcriptional regulator